MAAIPESLSGIDFEAAAREYLASLPLEHFMESTPHSMQGSITHASMEVLKSYRPDVQLYRELLIQYVMEGRIRRVVPDNMVVLADDFGPHRLSFVIGREPASPFWVFEYVSETDPDKDYVDSFRKYEQDLRVPYYLIFDFNEQDLRVFRHDGQQHVRLEPDITGRVAIEELNLQIGLLDGWVRYWYGGNLLLLPRELKGELDAAKEELVEAKEELDEAKDVIDSQQRQLKSKDELLAEQTAQIKAMQLELLRMRVAVRARKLSREDVLSQIAEADPGQLEAWRIELGLDS